MNPKLILADEPTGNLDSKNGLEVMQLLTELHQEGTTIVMVTHSERDAGYAQRTISLLDGQVVPEVRLWFENNLYLILRGGQSDLFASFFARCELERVET